VGCQVDGKAPHDVIDEVNEGGYDIPDVSFVLYIFLYARYLIIASVTLREKNYLE
jgi:hypothetical protein